MGVSLEVVSGWKLEKSEEHGKGLDQLEQTIVEI